MTEIKKYYDTDLIGSGGGYTMTEIEKLKEQLCGSKPQLQDFDTELMYRQALFNWNLERSYFDRHAAAVIELIRETIPEPRHVELTEGMPLGLSAPANAGYNAYRFEILKLLDTIK